MTIRTNSGIDLCN